jgi:hypothetical protein
VQVADEANLDSKFCNAIRLGVAERKIVSLIGHWRRSRMMQMTDMSTGMMLEMGLLWILVIVLLILGIAACIKYLRS